MTKKADVQLDQAKHSIDLLTVLQQKTEGNRTPEESGELEAALHELRMAYVTRASRNRIHARSGEDGAGASCVPKNTHPVVTCSSSRVTPPWY